MIADLPAMTENVILTTTDLMTRPHDLATLLNKHRLPKPGLASLTRARLRWYLYKNIWSLNILQYPRYACSLASPCERQYDQGLNLKIKIGLQDLQVSSSPTYPHNNMILTHH
jgi:hypothetical protein